MVIAGKWRRWHGTPATVFLIGIISLILLLWVERISNRLHLDEMRIDAVMKVQTHTSAAHLRLEEIIRGGPGEDITSVFAEVDQALHLVDVILNGGESENDHWIDEPLRDLKLRSRADEIKALVIQYKYLARERLLESKSTEKSSGPYFLFHAIFKDVLSKSKQLEEIIEKDETENQKKAMRLFLGIPAIWSFIVASATGALWYSERQRIRAGEELLNANEQLITQAEELTLHRERLKELVDAGTAELAAANERLRAEISERQQTEVALKNSEGQLRLLSSRLMTAQETERKYISRELHDELGHALTIMKLRLRAIERGLQGHAVIKADCEDIMDYIDKTIENVRRLSRDLSPTILEDLGLTASLRWLADNINRNFDSIILVEIDDIAQLFPENDQIMIYRILQEALTNIGKHARAGNVAIVIRKIEGGVSVLIEDDGRGFNLPLSRMRDPAGKGMGLAIMEERVRMLGGVLDLQAQEGKGTRIAFNIPTSKE